jgi:hypothetical protein
VSDTVVGKKGPVLVSHYLVYHYKQSVARLDEFLGIDTRCS